MSEKILAINPGSTSTKLAVFSGEEEQWSETLTHSSQKIEEFDRIVDQLEWRQELIIDNVKEAGHQLDELSAVVARGGLIDPIPGGTYRIDEEMVKDLREGKNGEHASNLAGIIAYNLAEERNIPAYTVDPVGVDEFEPVARLSGLPELPRRCQSHALNLKAVGRSTAEELGEDLEKINLIGVHLGGGISISAMKKGRIVDVNNANQGGPYSPERVGTLPAIDLVNYIFEEKPEKDDLKRRLVGKGGLAAYLNTNDGREIEEMIEKGDEEARLVYNGMIYQIAKEIGRMAAVLEGEVSAVFVTGGLANSDYIVEELEKKIDFIAPIKVFPGAKEMRHLLEGAIRVLEEKEDAKDYREESNRLKEEKDNLF